MVEFSRGSLGRGRALGAGPWWVGGLRLLCDQAPWEMRTEKPVIRLPSITLLLCLLASHSCLPTPPWLLHWCCVGLSPDICPCWAQTGKEVENPSRTKWGSRKGAQRLLLIHSTGGSVGAWTGHGATSWAAWERTGPWAVTGDLKTWRSASARSTCPRSLSSPALPTISGAAIGNTKGTWLVCRWVL